MIRILPRDEFPEQFLDHPGEICEGSMEGRVNWVLLNSLPDNEGMAKLEAIFERYFSE